MIKENYNLGILERSLSKNATIIIPEKNVQGHLGTVEDKTFFSIKSTVKRAHFSAEIRNGRNLRLVLIAVSINPGLITVTAILCFVR